MAYILNGTTIRRPLEIRELNSTQMSEQRTLAGNVGRDYFGSNKRVWELTYENVTPTDFTTIKNLYLTYLSTETALTWEVTETNYTVTETDVHVDLAEREFSVRGETYLSNFTLVLKEV